MATMKKQTQLVVRGVSDQREKNKLVTMKKQTQLVVRGVSDQGEKQVGDDKKTNAIGS